MGEREITARSDVYSLGAMTYEMLVGQPPFTGATAQAIMGKVLTAAPEPPRQARKSVPPHVEDAVLTALEKLPADRFATAAAFADALGAGVSSGANVAARPQSASRSSFPPARTDPSAGGPSHRCPFFCSSRAPRLDDACGMRKGPVRPRFVGVRAGSAGRGQTSMEISPDGRRVMQVVRQQEVDRS